MSLSQRGGHATSDARSDPASLLRPRWPLALVPLLSLSQISVRKAPDPGKLIPELPPGLQHLLKALQWDPCPSSGCRSITPRAAPCPPGPELTTHLGSFGSFATYFPHTRSLPHPVCCKTTPSVESLASGNFSLPSWPGMGLRAEPALANSCGGSTPQPHPGSPQAFGEEIGCFGFVQCPVFWRPAHHVLLHYWLWASSG